MQQPDVEDLKLARELLLNALDLPSSTPQYELYVRWVAGEVTDLPTRQTIKSLYESVVLAFMEQFQAHQIQRYRRFVWVVAGMSLLDDGDLLQEAFIGAWIAVPQYQAGADRTVHNVNGWLYYQVRSHLTGVIRRAKVRKAYEPSNEWSHTMENTEERVNMIEALVEAQHEARVHQVLLSVLDSMTEREQLIARAILSGVSWRSIIASMRVHGTTVSRVRAKLIERMRKARLDEQW